MPLRGTTDDGKLGAMPRGFSPWYGFRTPGWKPGACVGVLIPIVRGAKHLSNALRPFASLRACPEHSEGVTIFTQVSADRRGPKRNTGLARESCPASPALQDTSRRALVRSRVRP